MSISSWAPISPALTLSILTPICTNLKQPQSVEIEKAEMEEEEHEVYGGEIPDEGEMEGDIDAHNADVDMATNDDDAVKVFFLALPYFFQYRQEEQNPNGLK